MVVLVFWLSISGLAEPLSQAEGGGQSMEVSPKGDPNPAPEDDPDAQEEAGQGEARRERPPVPEVPEPMVFDLMRGLHAEAGELEVNVLAMFPRRGRTDWAPEIEFAVADGVAIEFEVPFENMAQQSWKYGLQFRLGFSEKSVHGVQLLTELDHRGERSGSLYALYLFGHRFNERWSLLSMSGPKLGFSEERSPKWYGVQNLALFYDWSPSWTTGIETNWTWSGDRALEELSITPQVHWQASEHWNLQFGVGAARTAGERWNPVYGVRLIWEL